jgi:hypothetical protein
MAGGVVIIATPRRQPKAYTPLFGPGSERTTPKYLEIDKLSVTCKITPPDM